MARNKAGQDVKIWQGASWVCSCGLTVRNDNPEQDKKQVEEHLLKFPTDVFEQRSFYTLLSRDGRAVIPDLPDQVPPILRQDELLILAGAEERPIPSATEPPESGLSVAEQPVLPSPEPGVFSRMVGAVKRTLGL